MIVRGHPTTLILAPIKSAYMTSRWSLVLSCSVSHILELFFAERPLLHSTLFRGKGFGGDVEVRKEKKADATHPVSLHSVKP